MELLIITGYGQPLPGLYFQHTGKQVVYPTKNYTMKKILILFILLSAVLCVQSQTVDKYFGNRIFNLNNRSHVLRNGTDSVERINIGSGRKFFTRIFLNDDSVSLVSTVGANKFLIYDSVTGQLQAIGESDLPGGGITSINSQTQSSQGISVGNGMNVSSVSGTHTISIQTTFITSGRYTPTLTGVTNVAGTTTHECTYYRVGNAVKVSGIIEIDPTASSSLTEVRVSLPITATVDFSTIYECTGPGNAISTQGSSGGFYADTTNEEAVFSFVTATDANQSISFEFTYFITPL
jgi:hypothetical protein